MTYYLSPDEGHHLSQTLGDRWLEIVPGYRNRQKVTLTLSNLAQAKAVYNRTNDLRLKDRIARAIPNAADPDHASQYKALPLTQEQKKAVRTAYPSLLPYNVFEGDNWRVDKYEAQVLSTNLTAGVWFDRPKGADEIAEVISRTFSS